MLENEKKGGGINRTSIAALHSATSMRATWMIFGGQLDIFMKSLQKFFFEVGQLQPPSMTPQKRVKFLEILAFLPKICLFRGEVAQLHKIFISGRRLYV